MFLVDCCLWAFTISCFTVAVTLGNIRVFEITVFGNLQGSHMFPAILEALNLKPFDLCKFIGSFVRSLPELPRMLKRHMFSMEERCLESLAWAKGSSL
jgi:Retinoblastoma-associated protein A domain